MLDAVALLENLTLRGVRLTPNPPKLIAEPASLLTDADREAIRAHKPELLALLAPRPAVEALSVLHRLRGYTLPAGGMLAARELVGARLRPLLAAPELDPAAALGGAYDPELAAAIDLERHAPELLDGGPGEHPDWTPAHSILATCQRHGVALRLDPDGTLVVGRAGAKADEPAQPWPSLLTAIETHLEAVARLVEAGWSLRAVGPNEAAA